MFRTLDASRFGKPSSQFAPGPAPILTWIEVGKLVVDGEYQRDIGKRGAANVRAIAEAFDWSKFAPVIVAPIEGGGYAVVDGQHRTTAAMLRGQKEVPCQIVQADRAKQAAAYAAVNGNVTKTTPGQLFHARLASGDANAEAVAQICRDAGVQLVRTNLTIAKMREGQTTAINALQQCYLQYGRDTLLLALRSITRTADGNAGYLRSTIIQAMCIVLHAHPDWRSSEELLLKHMDKFNFPDAWEAITGSRDQIFPNTARSDMAGRIEKHLARRFAQVTKRAA